MSQKTILVIDDSATIRRLIDGHLGSSGYTVVLAPTAEEGLSLAEDVLPDLILLDHQLPGTTGFEVCTALANNPRLQKIPVVVSSTLRKRAYVEYADLSNVVDMLPKPYTTELLETTVVNAIETGTMIVQSQTQGTAIPEVIEAQTEASLSGSFDHVSPREIIDFLNNGSKKGVLEVVFGRYRVWIYLSDGRIQAVTATGVQPQELTCSLPDSLRDLAPVFEMTVSAHRGTAADSLVQLLNNQVLDPRLLRKLLRHQAAVLMLKCFHDKPDEFRFHACREAPALCQQLPLEVSLVALLVEAACICDASEISDHSPDMIYARHTQRGQNLDRCGLSPNHMKVLSVLNDGNTVNELAQQLQWDTLTVRRTLHGLVLAGLARTEIRTQQLNVVVYNTDADSVRTLRMIFSEYSDEIAGKIVRDALAFQLLLKKQPTSAVIIRVCEAGHLQLLRQLTPIGRVDPLQNELPRWIALTTAEFEIDVAKYVHQCLPPAPDSSQLRDALRHRTLRHSNVDATLCLASSTS